MNGSGSSSIKAGDIVKCIQTPWFDNSVVITGPIPEEGYLYYVERTSAIKFSDSPVIGEGLILVGIQMCNRQTRALHAFNAKCFVKVERYCLAEPASNYKRGVHDAEPITVEPLPDDMLKEALQLANLY